MVISTQSQRISSAISRASNHQILSHILLIHHIQLWCPQCCSTKNAVSVSLFLISGQNDQPCSKSDRVLDSTVQISRDFFDSNKRCLKVSLTSLRAEWKKTARRQNFKVQNSVYYINQYQLSFVQSSLTFPS